MPQCSGEIGAFFQGDKQIGGFLDWTIELTLTYSDRPQGRVYRKAMTKATANRFWLVCEPLQGEIMALYYRLIGERLILINKATVQVELGKVVDKVINRPIEMIWTS